MKDDTTIPSFHQPGSIIDPLTEIAREGARQMLMAALKAEAASFVAQFGDERLPDGRQRVVRHGTGPERTIQTGIGPIRVARRKVRDRATDAPPGAKIRFTSNILPRWARRSRSLDALLPVLYPDGYCRSEDHPVVLARHPLQQAGPVPVQRPAREGGVSIEDLAASIARRGLIQGLSVQPVVDADGVETGMFEVPAGGRRFRALELLVKQKRLAKIAPVPCIVRDRDSEILAEEVSLAENIERAPLLPLDQFRAFQDMRAKHMTEEEIAAAFFVQVNVVKQRLRLASVSQALLNVYAEDGMTLEQLMAFTVSEDYTRQQQVWDAIKDAWSKEPYHPNGLTD